MVAEVGEQRLAHRRAREDQVEVGEEAFDARVVVAHRLHDVVPVARVDVARGARDAGDDLRLEHVGRRQRHAAHVHDVEDAVGAGDVVGRHDDEHDVVDEVGRETAALVLPERREHVVRAFRVRLDVALRLRRDVGLAQVEERLEVAALHVFAEEALVLFAQAQPRLGGDAAQLVAGLGEQPSEARGQLRVVLEREQHGEDDRQRHEALLAIDDLMHAAFVAHEDQRAEEIRSVVDGACVGDVLDELPHLHVMPAVGALERRDREAVVGCEHLGQRLFARANRHIVPLR